MPAAPTLSTSEMAALLMLTPRRLQQLVALGSLPKTTHGRFEVVRTVQAYFVELRRQRESADAPERVAVLRERAREIAARNLRSASELISAGEASAVFADVLRIYRGQLEAFVAEAYAPGPDRARLAALVESKIAVAEASWSAFINSTRANAR